MLNRLYFTCCIDGKLKVVGVPQLGEFIAPQHGLIRGEYWIYQGQWGFSVRVPRNCTKLLSHTAGESGVCWTEVIESCCWWGKITLNLHALKLIKFTPGNQHHSECIFDWKKCCNIAVLQLTGLFLCAQEATTFPLCCPIAVIVSSPCLSNVSQYSL
jgi:hypothetical protein